MACSTSQDNIRNRLNAITECAICAETCNDPRILPCVHTYCLECLRGFCRDKNPRDLVECPLCRRKFTIPPSGVDGLPKNFLVEQLKDVVDASINHCEGCSSGKNKSATMFCGECQQRLCEACVDSHSRLRATRTHKLMKLTDGEEIASTVMRMASGYCDKHDNEALKWYCTECGAPICVTCFIEQHKSHECSDINKTADEFRMQMQEDVGKLRYMVAKFGAGVGELKRNKAEFSAKSVDIRREICDRAEQLKQFIEQKKQLILEEVDYSVTARETQIDSVVDIAEQQISLAENLVMYANELAKKGTAGQIVQQKCTVHNRTIELLRLGSIQKAIVDLGSVDITFKPITWPTQLDENILGNFNMVKVKAETPMPSLTDVIYGNRPVVSLTAMKDELFVIRRPHKQQIEVYSTSTFDLQRTLPMPLELDQQAQSLTRLASCETNHCLYVSDFVKDNVHKIHLNAVDGKLTWQVGRRPVGLSVNDKCHVIVTSDRSNAIEEYTTNGKLVCRITLDKSNIEDLWHAIDLTNGRYVVSHSQPANGVTVVNGDGRVLFTCRDDLKSNPRLLVKPRYFSFGNSKCFLVADDYRNKIVRLNSSLSCTRDLPLSLFGGLDEPYCLHFDGSRGRLYIGEYGGRRTLVFDDVIP